MIVYATLRVRGPAIRVTVEGHPQLAHNGQGESIWTVAMDSRAFEDLTQGLRQTGLEFEVVRPAKTTHSKGKYDACQFCAFFDPASVTQCGFTDWDSLSRGQMSETPDGESSLGRCPDLHSDQ